MEIRTAESIVVAAVKIKTKNIWESGGAGK